MPVRFSLIRYNPMLYNQNKLTDDTGFLASSWHIRSRGMFAGSCIGVICLVIVLEFLRRIAREYDAFIVHRAQMRAQYLAPAQNPAASSSSDSADASGTQKSTAACPPAASSKSIRVRPTLIEQIVRALLHMLQFAVAYFVMLLAMYFNGYIIICIFIGAFLGSFIFSWEYIGGGSKEYVASPFF